MPEDYDPRSRDKDVRILLVQFLRDREIGICSEKQGVIINDNDDDNDDKKQY